MYDLLASELHNRPHLVTANRLDALSAYVMSRQGFNVQVPEQPKPMAFMASDTAEWSDNGYYIDGGVAIIDMIGTMVHRGTAMQAMSGIVAYNRIARCFSRAMKDPAVNAIMINGDTPGGAVSGAFDLSDLIYSARGVKPVYTLAADCLCSAGILIGSSSEKVYTTQTGQVGSIGVVMKHMDISKWNTKTGINNTYIYAGDRKIDGNPNEPLSKQVQALFQDEIQTLYGMFTSLMARNIDLSEQEIIDTQAGVYLGQAAVDIGLAVDVTTADKLLEDMKTEFGTGRSYLTTTTSMETQTMSKEDKETPSKTATRAGDEQSSAPVEKAAVKGTDTGTDKGAETSAAPAHVADKGSDVKTANERFAAIMESDAAQGRHKAAIRLAKTDMTADEVIATLEDLPREASGPSKLDQAMKAEGSTGVQAEGAAGESELTDTQKILGDYSAALGKQA